MTTGLHEHVEQLRCGLGGGPYIYIYTYIHTYMYVCVHMDMCVYMYMHMKKCNCICIMCLSLYMYMYMYMYMCMCMCMYIYIYIYMYVCVYSGDPNTECDKNATKSRLVRGPSDDCIKFRTAGLQGFLSRVSGSDRPTNPTISRAISRTS